MSKVGVAVLLGAKSIITVLFYGATLISVPHRGFPNIR